MERKNPRERFRETEQTLGRVELFEGSLNGRQADLPAAEAERADPVLDHAELVHKALFYLPKPLMGHTTPGMHPREPSSGSVPLWLPVSSTRGPAQLSRMC